MPQIEDISKIQTTEEYRLKYTYMSSDNAKAHMLRGGECRYLDGGIVIYDRQQKRFKYRDQENGWTGNSFDALKEVKCHKAPEPPTRPKPRYVHSSGGMSASQFFFIMTMIWPMMIFIAMSAAHYTTHIKLGYSGHNVLILAAIAIILSFINFAIGLKAIDKANL